MSINVLVTGGAGFLAINTARFFNEKGAVVFGIGRSNESTDLSCYEKWVESAITYKSLLEFDVNFDIIVHCGGGSSVGYAQENPFEDFHKTVIGTAELLEFVRKHCVDAHVIYPSSPAVHGQQQNQPIDELSEINPVSVYGYHKKMAEDLLLCSNKVYGIKVSIIRFYSIYGIGLRKQLLWDACVKIKNSNHAVFWGNGDETRDWININDAVSLIHFLSSMHKPPLIVNGGSGIATTVRESVELLKNYLESSADLNFNGYVKIGDPKYYCAGQHILKDLGWSPEVSVHDGFFEYVQWFINNYD